VKHLKFFVLALAATGTLVMLGGAGSASATVLCKITATPCGAANHVSAGSLIEAELKPGTAAVLEAPMNPTITCSTGGLVYKTETTGGAASTVAGSTVRWPSLECHANGIGADIAVTILGQFEFHHISGTENATITAKNVEFWFKYTFLESGWCKAKSPEGSTDFGTLVGGASPTIVVNASFTTSFSCGMTANFKAEYTITNPKPLYVEPS
jgi:hypothetical protein